MLSIEADFSHFLNGYAEDPLLRGAVADYLEFRLKDTALVQNPLSLLRSHYPHLLSIRQDEALHGLYREKKERRERLLGGAEGQKTGIGDDFRAFLEEIYGLDEGESNDYITEKTALFESMVKQDGEAR
jgi:hypothetical protein